MNAKKILKAVSVILVSVMFIAGCGQNKTAEKTPALSKDEVLNKVAAYDKEIKSAKLSVVTDSDMKFNDQNLKSKSDMIVEIIKNPTRIHIYTKTTIPEEKPTEMDLYMDDTNLYTKIGNNEKYTKVSLKESGLSPEEYKKMLNNNDSINFFKELKNDIKMEEKDGNYILSYFGNGEKVEKFIKENSGLPKEVTSNIEKLTVRKYEFKSVYSKKDFKPVSMDMDMDMDMVANKEKLVIKQKVKTKYIGVNDIKDIKMPEEVENK